MKTGRRLGKIPIIVVLYGHFPGCSSPLEDEGLRSVPACAFEPQPQDGAQEKFVSTSREGGNEFKIGAAGSTRSPYGTWLRVQQTKSSGGSRKGGAAGQAAERHQ